MNNKSGTEGTEFDIDWIAVGYNIWLASLLRAMAGYTSILFTAIPIDVLYVREALRRAPLLVIYFIWTGGHR